jgi:hypothetical protein
VKLPTKATSSSVTDVVVVVDPNGPTTSAGSVTLALGRVETNVAVKAKAVGLVRDRPLVVQPVRVRSLSAKPAVGSVKFNTTGKEVPLRVPTVSVAVTVGGDPGNE